MTENADDPETALPRPQRRLLRRIYNGRTEPIVIEGKPFLTYKDASRHLLSLPEHERDAVYLEMKRQSQSAGQSDGQSDAAG